MLPKGDYSHLIDDEVDVLAGDFCTILGPIEFQQNHLPACFLVNGCSKPGIISVHSFSCDSHSIQISTALCFIYQRPWKYLKVWRKSFTALREAAIQNISMSAFLHYLNEFIYIIQF